MKAKPEARRRKADLTQRRKDAELENWKAPTAEMPDSEITVVLRLKDEAWPIVLGFRDEDQWMDVRAGVIDCEVLGWMHLEEAAAILDCAEEIPVFQCTKCKRFFVHDHDADDGEVIPGHPMKVLVEDVPEWMKTGTPFLCDLEDCK